MRAVLTCALLPARALCSSCVCPQLLGDVTTDSDTDSDVGLSFPQTLPATRAQVPQPSTGVAPAASGGRVAAPSTGTGTGGAARLNISALPLTDSDSDDDEFEFRRSARAHNAKSQRSVTPTGASPAAAGQEAVGDGTATGTSTAAGADGAGPPQGLNAVIPSPGIDREDSPASLNGGQSVPAGGDGGGGGAMEGDDDDDGGMDTAAAVASFGSERKQSRQSFRLGRLGGDSLATTGTPREETTPTGASSEYETSQQTLFQHFATGQLQDGTDALSLEGCVKVCPWLTQPCVDAAVQLVAVSWLCLLLTCRHLLLCAASAILQAN